MVVNTSFPEVDQLAAGFAEAGLLSAYVRLYANLGRMWECWLADLPGLGGVYPRLVGRRTLPDPLDRTHVREAGVMLDFALAAHRRLPANMPAYTRVRKVLMHARTRSVARLALSVLSDEKAVLASWGCAEPVVRRMKQRGGLCVLNYALAHHRFTRRYLREEAGLQPLFACTLNGHDRPEWFEQRLDAEIDLADQILVGSSFVRDSFVAEGIPASKLVVIPYGTDTRLFEPIDSKVSPDKFNVLFVGQIGQRKGLSYLLEAYERFHGPKTSLTLVGEIQGTNKPLEPYRHLFRHVPHVPKQELREIYRQADVFLFPTLVEGMPIVVLEAMASGLPVITTPNGPGDIMRDGVDGFLVPPRDVDALVDRLERLRTEPELRAQLGRNARERAQRFTWTAYRKTAVSQIESWLAGPRAVEAAVQYREAESAYQGQ